MLINRRSGQAREGWIQGWIIFEKWVRSGNEQNVDKSEAVHGQNYVSPNNASLSSCCDRVDSLALDRAFCSDKYMMPWFSNFQVPHPSSRLPLTFGSFCTDFLPAVLAYYLAGVLVILPGTRTIRLALLPVTLWLLFRAATSLDIGAACGDPGYDFLGYGLGVSSWIIRG